MSDPAELSGFLPNALPDYLRHALWQKRTDDVDDGLIRFDKITRAALRSLGCVTLLDVARCDIVQFAQARGIGRDRLDRVLMTLWHHGVRLPMPDNPPKVLADLFGYQQSYLECFESGEGETPCRLAAGSAEECLRELCARQNLRLEESVPPVRYEVWIDHDLHLQPVGEAS